MRIAFDVGGVLSKYPSIFKPLLAALHLGRSDVEVFIISDMHPVEKVIDMLERNKVCFYKHRVRSADYKTHGELCKAMLCMELEIDILIDDHPGYVAVPGTPPVRLLVMPDPNLPYYASNKSREEEYWHTDGSEGDFGRRNPPESKNPGRASLPSKDANFLFFKEILPGLLTYPDNHNRFVLIRNQKVAGVFDTEPAAINAGYMDYGLGPFIVKKITVISGGHHGGTS